mgnify:FL=1
MTKSIEEKIEDIAKKSLDEYGIKYFTKTESINKEIDDALKKAESKSGGKGGNFPDIKVMIKTHSLGYIPVMIEVKGTKNCLEKTNSLTDIVENRNEKGEINYSTVKKYAVNGAIHYAESIINYTKSYKNIIAIGINGYKDSDEIKTEYGVYYISQDNLLIPKKIAEYSDLSFLQYDKIQILEQKIQEIFLSKEEKELKTKDFENQIETILQKLNQNMHDNLNIKDTDRVQLVCGLIMAALGVNGGVRPLEIEELKGQTGQNSNDGAITINKIRDFLSNRNLPEEKKKIIDSMFFRILLERNNYMPKNGESPIKTVYTVIKDDIMPIFSSAKHLDFTGRLFNVLNSWIALRPGDDKNDVVLTPRYVTEFMAKLCKVNKDSYVWDYAAGSGGFLISSMKLMIEDAQKTITSEKEKFDKINKIKYEQLLGIEIRPDIYMLAVLNMILMGDGSSHILNTDSLTDYDGKYEQKSKIEEKIKNNNGNGEDIKENKNFPANVFLLNPPYSAKGKGFIFVEKALSKMNSGRAAILIQENAGSGNGLDYTKNILKNNTLVASIHMSDVFCGKAGVQTAIYVFEVGTPHDINNIVKFIDFSNDGYTRQNRRKSSQNVNLKNTDNAPERYQEVIDIVLNRKKETHYFDDYVIEDTITLNGNDWTYSQHQKIDTVPTEKDFKKTVADYLSWKVSTILKEENHENFQ